MKQSHPIAAFRETIFSLRTSAGGTVPGQTFSGTDLQFAKPGQTSFANCSNQAAVVELGNGVYKYIWPVGEIDTPGTGQILKVAKAGAVQVEYGENIERAAFATIVAGTLLANSFTTDRSETVNNYWKDALILALSGSLVGQVKKVGGFNGGSKLITLAPGLAFTAAPAIGDVFELINR